MWSIAHAQGFKLPDKDYWEFVDLITINPRRVKSLDDYLDRLVGEYSDLVSGGAAPSHAHFLAQVPREARPGLERCLKMIDAGLAQAPSAAQPRFPENA